MVTLTGMHPRSEYTIQATQDWERGRTDSRSLRDSFRKDVEDIIRLQHSLGFDYITDGQLTMAWQDIFRPFVRHVEGIRKGPLVRWFNTNTFYYAPIIFGELSSDGKAVYSAIDRAYVKSISKVIIPDPLTFAESSEDKFYKNKSKLMFEFSEKVLNEEIAFLERVGVRYVQFSSPSLVARFRDRLLNRDELAELGEAVRTALKGIHIESGYHTFFGDASQYMPYIFDYIPTNDIGFDFTETDINQVTSSNKGIIAGLVNSRSSYLERPGLLAKQVRMLIDKFSRITIAPSCDLHYIPRSVADEKLAIISRTRRMISDEL